MPGPTNGTVITNGDANGSSMSTLPQEGHNWQISLKDKVIASTYSEISHML